MSHPREHDSKFILNQARRPTWWWGKHFKTAKQEKLANHRREKRNKEMSDENRGEKVGNGQEALSLPAGRGGRPRKISSQRVRRTGKKPGKGEGGNPEG